MNRKGYSYQGKEENIARALAKGVEASPKASIEIANNIRGKKLSKAKALLERVIEGKEPIRYTRFNRGVGHRKGSFGPGRFPLKASSAVLGLLEEVEANAEYRGLNTENLVIAHVAANRGQILQGRYKGSAHNTPTTNIEIVVKEQ
jgi:large subunit ribosomal protein L22